MGFYSKKQQLTKWLFLKSDAKVIHYQLLINKKSSNWQFFPMNDQCSMMKWLINVITEQCCNIHIRLY